MTKFQLLINYLFWTFRSNKLHLSAVQTPSQGGDMVPTLSINIYDSEHCVVSNPNSCLQIFYHTQNSPNYLITRSQFHKTAKQELRLKFFLKWKVYSYSVKQNLKLKSKIFHETGSCSWLLKDMFVVLYRNLNVVVVLEKISWFLCVLRFPHGRKYR